MTHGFVIFPGGLFLYFYKSSKVKKIPEKRPLVKNAPEEISSKIRPKKFRQVVPVEKKVRIIFSLDLHQSRFSKTSV